MNGAFFMGLHHIKWLNSTDCHKGHRIIIRLPLHGPTQINANFSLLVQAWIQFWPRVYHYICVHLRLFADLSI